MEKEETKEMIRTEVQIAGKYKEVSAESTAEYVLPDYNEDIRKVIFTKAMINPTGAFVDGDEVVFSGAIDYNLIYSDPDGEIRALDFTSDYEFPVKCDEESHVGAVGNPRINSVYLRLTGPRKLNVRTGIVTNVSLTKREAKESSGSAFSGDEPQILTEKARVHGRMLSATSEREYAEVIYESDSIPPDSLSVLLRYADAHITEAALTEGGVSLKGEVDVTAILKNEGEAPFTVFKTLPIDETVAFDGEIPEGSCFIGEVTPVSLTVSVNPEDMGSCVTASLVIELMAAAEYNQTVEVVCDAYLKECVTECIYDDFSYPELECVGSEEMIFEREITKESCGAEEVREPLYFDAAVKIDSVENLLDKISLRGEIRLCGIGNNTPSDSAISCSNIKATLPFDEKVNLNCHIPQNSRIFVEACAGRVKAECDSEKLYFSLPVRVLYLADSDKKLRYVAACEKRDELTFSKSASVITVYYPDRGETLFGIAKKFHTTVRDIAVANSLSEACVSGEGSCESLSGIKRLLIK